MKIAIIGAGAIGSIIGGLLSEAGQQVTLVGRKPHTDVINNQGLTIEGALGKKNVKVAATEQLTSEPDVAFITVKTQDLEPAIRENIDLLRDSLVVTVQNGVQADTIAGRLLGQDNLASCVVLFGATFLEPGKVTYSPAGSLVLGKVKGENTPAIQALANSLSAFIPTHLTDNIEGAHWTKLIINELNALPAITGLSIQELMHLRAMQDTTVALVREACDVTAAAGIKLTPLPNTPIAVINMLSHAPAPIARLLPKMMSRRMGKIPALGSTLQSLKRGEKTEIDYLNGEVVTLGQKVGLPTPANTWAVELVHRVEATGAFIPVPEAARSLATGTL